MKKTLILVALFMATNLLAQNAVNIIGKWAYVDLQDKSELDEVGKEMAAMMFKDLTMNFRTDNTMSLTMRKTPDGGTYTFDNDNENIINAVSQGGKPMTLTIVKLTENELIIKLGQIGAMIMKKVSVVPDTAPAITPKVAATMKQISGKWYVVGSDDKELSEMAAELLKGSYVFFGDDGWYESSILSVGQEGTWEFGQDRTTIIVTMEDDMGTWNIYEISDDKLVMQNDTSVKKMIFSRKQ